MGKPINNATVEMLQNLIKDIKANYIKKDDIDFYVQLPDMPTATEKYGGTWEIIEELQGRVMLGSGGEYVFGATGGSADAVNVEHNHLSFLTPDGQSYLTYGGSFATANENQFQKILGGLGGNGWLTASGKLYTSSTGEDGTGKNMQPYMVVNFWKRINTEET